MKEANIRPVYWLHISDLHFGAKGKEIFQQSIDEFFRFINKLPFVLSKAPDVIILTGDVSYSGQPWEYEQADIFLEKLISVLKKLYQECNPVFVCIPGNHDLVRPKLADALKYDVFNRYAISTNNDQSVKYLNEILWENNESEMLKPLFSGYLVWLDGKISKLKSRMDVEIHTSHIPGDICIELNLKNTFPLLVVGLNSAWLQYNDLDYEGRLSIPTAQFHSVLPHDENSQNQLDIFKKYRRALLIQHHPPSWLSTISQGRFCSEIFLPDRFDMCLYGHMHTGRAKQISVSGGAPRYEFQSPSLFGLVHYGCFNEERAFGFSLGCITFDGEIRVWPYTRVALAGGEHAFLWDQSYGDGTEHSDGVLLRSGDIPDASSRLHELISTATSSPTATATEGAILHVELVEFQRAEHQRTATIEFLNKQLIRIAKDDIATEQLEIIECSWDGKFTLFLPRLNGQSWNKLFEQVLRYLLIVFSVIKQYNSNFSNEEWIPQLGVVLHAEYDGCRLQLGSGNFQEFRPVGDGINRVRSMLPNPVKPYIILSSEAYRYLGRLLSDPKTIGGLLSRVLLGETAEQNVQIDVEKLTIVHPKNNPHCIDNPLKSETNPKTSVIFQRNVHKFLEMPI